MRYRAATWWACARRPTTRSSYRRPEQPQRPRRPQGYPEGVRRRHGRSQGRAELLYRPVYGNRQRHRGTALRLFHVRSAHPGYQVEVRRGHRQAPVGRQQGQRAAGITSTDTHTALSGGPFGLPLSHSTTLASAQSYCRVFGCRLSVSLMLILRLLRGRLAAEGIMERENTIHFPT